MECILYDSIESENKTNSYYESNLWHKLSCKNKIKNYWFIGENTGRNFWVMDKNRNINFLQFENEKLYLKDLFNVNIDFEDWLKFAFLNRDFNEILDKYSVDDPDFKYYPQNTAIEYIKNLDKISISLRGTIHSYWS
jgi:hypothetical protein